MREPSIAAAYVVFCDSNDLVRIDATPEQKLSNLDRMLLALLDERHRQQRIINNRCPACAGTGWRE